METQISFEKIKLLFFSIGTILITYGFGLTNYSLSIDSETPVYPDFSMGLGRWGTNLVRYHIFEGHTPYFTLLLGLLLMSLAAVELTKLFKLSTFKSYLFCALFLTIPQLSYQLIFTMQADVVPLGFLISVLSINLFSECSKDIFSGKSIIYFILSALMLMFVIALYQALILIPVVIFVVLIFQNTYSEEFSYKNEVKKVALFGCLLIISGLLYYISVTIISPAGQGGFLSTYASGNSNNRLKDFFTLWLDHLKGKLYYGNKTTIFLSLISLFGIIIIIKDKKHIALKLILLLLLLLIPYSLSFFITNGYHPPRLYVGLGIVFAFLATHFLDVIKYKKIILVICSIICIWNIYFITQLFYSNYKIFNHDKTVAKRIDTEIRTQFPEFDVTTNYVYFYGCLSFQEHDRFRLPDSEVFGGSLFSWDNGNNYRIINFFSFNDIAYYRMIDNKETYLKIKDSIESMPVWPAKQSVKLIDNVVIVKLGSVKGSPLPIE